MTGTAVSIEGLTKAFGGSAVASVDGLTIDIPAGGVFGLLGPNGSGKTTTLRMMFGLVAPSAGTIRVFDTEVPRDLPAVLPRMGGLLEGPTLFPTFTGRRNLEVLAAVRSISGVRIDEVLELVELHDRQRDQVRTYSLGMKQRLGIAGALLSRPELLVLDEPSNGLDPAGLVDMRALIRRIAASGDATVVVSSHLLAEMEQVCDRVAIIAKGRLIASGRPSELAASVQRSSWVSIEVINPQGAMEVLRLQGHHVELDETGTVLLVKDSDQRQVLATLVGADLEVVGVARPKGSLESTFLALTKEHS